MRENTEQKDNEYGHLAHSEKENLTLKLFH